MSKGLKCPECHSIQFKGKYCSTDGFPLIECDLQTENTNSDNVVTPKSSHEHIEHTGIQIKEELMELIETPLSNDLNLNQSQYTSNIDIAESYNVMLVQNLTQIIENSCLDFEPG